MELPQTNIFPNCFCYEFVGFGRRGLFRKVHLLEILENLEILEILENPQAVENKGESDHFLEILENLEILEILQLPPVKDPFRNDPFFRSRIWPNSGKGHPWANTSLGEDFDKLSGPLVHADFL